MSEAQQFNALMKLVLFMVCLAAAGSILAGAHYYAVDLPQQNAIRMVAPTNGDLQWCINTYIACIKANGPHCWDDYYSCAGI